MYHLGTPLKKEVIISCNECNPDEAGSDAFPCEEGAPLELTESTARELVEALGQKFHSDLLTLEPFKIAPKLEESKNLSLIIREQCPLPVLPYERKPSYDSPNYTSLGFSYAWVTTSPFEPPFVTVIDCDIIFTSTPLENGELLVIPGKPHFHQHTFK